MTVVAAVLLAFFGSFAAAQSQEAVTPVTVYFFWGDGCPYCLYESRFLDALQTRYPHVEVAAYEVWFNEENRALLFEMAKKHGFEVSGVPVTIIGDSYWVGFNDRIAYAIEQAVVKHGRTDAPGSAETGVPAADAAPAEVQPSGEGSGEEAASPDPVISLPLVGDMSLANTPLFVTTLLIAFVDGFNPCSLWVLSLLLALVIHSRSRKKLLVVGITFLVMTSLVYGAFIVGLFGVFQFTHLAPWIRIAIATLTLLIAVVNIRDYFSEDKQFTLAIPEKHKRPLYERMRAILRTETLGQTFWMTATMSAGIAVVEFPCTAGFPVLWTNILSHHKVTSFEFVSLLLVYLVVYLLDELLLFLAALITLRVTKLEERHGRLLKLGAGVIMLFLSLALLFKPELMWSLAGSLQVFGLAFVTMAAVHAVYTRLRPSLRQ